MNNCIPHNIHSLIIFEYFPNYEIDGFTGRGEPYKNILEVMLMLQDINEQTGRNIDIIKHCEISTKEELINILHEYPETPKEI